MVFFIVGKSNQEILNSKWNKFNLGVGIITHTQIHSRRTDTFTTVNHHSKFFLLILKREYEIMFSLITKRL